MMRMHARRRPQYPGIRRGQRSSPRIAGIAGPGDDQSRNTGGSSTLQYRVTISIETVVCEVGADVD